MSTAVLFSESYYRRVLAEFGYTPFDLRQFDFSLAGLEAETSTPATCATTTGSSTCAPHQTGAS